MGENNRCYSYLSQMQNDANWCRGGVGHAGVEWVIQGWSGCEKISLNNLICHKLGVLSFLLKNYCQLLSR